VSSPNRPARLNRVLLALLGFVLLAAGGFALAVHFGVRHLLSPDSALVPGTRQPSTLVLYLVAAGAILIGLLCLRWLAAQLLVKPKTHVLRFEHDVDRGRTELASGTAIAPFLDELETYPGVRSARGNLLGTRAAARLSLVITADQDGDLAEIRRCLDTTGLPRLRHALDLESLPVTAEFRVNTQPAAPRVR
jgi:hypothetical protein